MEQRPRTRRKKRKLKINYGLIIFGVIILYIIGSFIVYMMKPKVSIYEVTQSSQTTEKELTGVIVREEVISNAKKTGYVNYYFREGAKVAKDMVVYTLDEDSQIHNQLTESEQNVNFTNKDITEIKRTIDKYRKSFDSADYTQVYALRDDLSAKIREIIDSNLLDQMQAYSKETDTSKNFNAVLSDQAGIITYYSDNYDGLTEDGINPEVFNPDNYQKKNLRSAEVIESGFPVYKLFLSNDWKIICPIDQETMDSIGDKTALSFVIEEDQTEVTAPVEVVKEGQDLYLKISMSKYLLNYSSERFLSIKFSLNKQSGLKLPVSAVITKDFYMIPKEYFIKGGDSNQLGLMADVYDEDKKEMLSVFTPVEIYCSDDTYYYVDENDIEYNTRIKNAATNEEYQITMIGQLQGAFNLNKGYAIFRQIEVLEEGKEYVIVKEGTYKGLNVYDHIALNAKLVKEGVPIY